MTAGPGSSSGDGESLHPRPGYSRGSFGSWAVAGRPCHEIKSFLSRSRVPHRWLDSEQDQNAGNTLEQPGDGNHAVVLFPDGTKLIDPDVRELAATAEAACRGQRIYIPLTPL